MPYKYKKLSQKEREEIVKYRRQQGYPLHALPHPFREKGTYLITAANFEHKAVMASPERRTEFQELLLHGFQEATAEIVAWVILPKHYHVLAGVKSLDKEVYDWPWSSIFMYEDEKGNEWLRDFRKNHMPQQALERIGIYDD